MVIVLIKSELLHVNCNQGGWSQILRTLFVPRLSHTCGPEAEVDPDPAAHAPRRDPGFQRPSAFTTAGHILPFHQNGDRFFAHFYSASSLIFGGYA